jgi:hypothetical protein
VVHHAVRGRMRGRDPAARCVAGLTAVGTGCCWRRGQGSMHGEGSNTVNHFVGQPDKEGKWPGPIRNFQIQISNQFNLFKLDFVQNRSS